MERTHGNGTLSLANLNQNVVLVGWVAKKRNLGGLQFVDLRDRTGIVQILLKGELGEIDIRNEYVLQVYGVVAKKEVANKNLATGEIEVIATKVIVVNKADTTPMIIDDVTDALEDTRLKYRYLDLRRPVMQKRLLTRAKIVKATHEYLDDLEFTEIETPILNLSTPGGARDYLVPSRIHKGSFYALPQSPQLFKQLLMIGGLERYYQVARCFRDEDLRADRQPDFTQIDIEASFLSTDQFLKIMEGLLAKIFKDSIGVDIKLPLRRMEWNYAIDVYGTDKPDTRFGMEIVDVKEIMKKSDFEAFKTLNYIRAIVVKNVADVTSRKVIDELQLEAKKFNLKGVTVLKYLSSSFEGSFAKFLSNDVKEELVKTLNVSNGDIVLIAAGDKRLEVASLLGALRNKYAKELKLIKPNTYDLIWLIHFPLFGLTEDGKLTPEHHAFTRAIPEDIHYLYEDPSRALSDTYDIVINGYEAGGGSARIYDQDEQRQIFKILGMSDDEVKRKFGFFIDAFKYGTPPHGGIAFGLDRLAMILSGADNIRDVIAFPKNLAAVCPMSQAPQPVDQDQIDELGLLIKK